MLNADTDLLRQFKAGNSDAFRTLVERYTPAIHRASMRWVGDAMEAENIAQETFIRVIHALDQIDLERPFKPYLFRIAINLCYDHGRKKRPMLFSDLDAARRATEDADDASESIPDHALPPWEQLEKQALAREVSAAVAQLPSHYKTVIVLRYLEEFSYEEIAATLEIPLNTVRTHLRRAKIQLRALLNQHARPKSSRPPRDTVLAIFQPKLQGVAAE
ncbi:MAG: sigma-70 family RNA polymerase sigma factor [Chloroflexi bacterium]|nr:sigma-70 family RNA polymerase sigma factor [Chloroflexota bacterium]